MQLGVVAAGHQTSAAVGADVLQAGGNAVDAVLGALLAACTCEPLLTGLGAGGYMLVVPPGEPPVSLDFFVAAPGGGRAVSGGRRAAPGGSDGARVPQMAAVEVSFGDAAQVFHGGPASAGVYGLPAGVVAASRRFGRLPLSEVAAPGARLAREGVALSEKQAYIAQIVAGLATLTDEAAALFAPGGRLLAAGEPYRDPALADALEELGAHGAQAFYVGGIARAVADWLAEHGGLVSFADLGAYRVLEREPIRVRFRGREVLTTPPSSAGGVLLARTLARLDAVTPPTRAAALVAAMQEAQALRTPEFLERLNDVGFTADFVRAARVTGSGGAGGRLGSTTHIAAIDAGGLACSVTTSNGSSSGVVVPGTGIHLNNMLGEQDLNPLGFHLHPAGRRLPSMMTPTAVLRDGRPELVLGSAGSNRIRSAILQTILRVLEDGMTAGEAVLAPRLHFEDGAVFYEPGADISGLDPARYELVAFRERNLFFGGAQAVEWDGGGRFRGGGDPRRGGAAIVVEG